MNIPVKENVVVTERRIDMMNVYKVVTQDRYSCIIPKKNPYCLQYIKDTIVEGIEGTLGIMCFETKEYADSFIKMQYFRRLQGLKIIKVSLIGKITYPEFISKWLYNTEIDKFYKVKYTEADWSVLRPPGGTICCDKVKVLT